MTEPVPEYTTEPDDAPPDAPFPAALLPAGPQTLARLNAYFERRRDALIAELREIDRYLGRPQTIPVRRR